MRSFRSIHLDKKTIASGGVGEAEQSFLFGEGSELAGLNEGGHVALLVRLSSRRGVVGFMSGVHDILK